MEFAIRGWTRNTWLILLCAFICLAYVTPTQAQDAPDPVKAIGDFLSRIIAPANTSSAAVDKPAGASTVTRTIDSSSPTTGETRNLTISSTGKRIALVIGNDAYQKVTRLQKAGNDATTMARELRSAGFDTTLHRDLNYQDMVRAVEVFSNRINGGDQVVVFFAGHGVQIKTGSYLLPVDIEASSESQVEKTAYGLVDLTDKLSGAKASFALVMVDACRDNPLKTNGRSVGGNRGLSAIEPPKGQIVVYSASKGQQALDRLDNSDNDPNGVFTREFIKSMKKPGVKIEDLVRQVQDSVETLAQSVHHEQRPAIYNESRGNFYFFGPTTVQVQGGQSGSMATDPETQTWDAAQSVHSVAAYQTYLDTYPQGRYASAARIKLGALKQPTAPSAPFVAGKPPSSTNTDPETAFWNEVKTSGLREYLDAYFKQYPKGKYQSLARIELKKLDEADKAQLVRGQAEKQQAEQTAWVDAKAANSADAYAAYLSSYPRGHYAALAQVAQKKLQRDAADQQRQDVARQQRAQIEAAQREESEHWRKAETATDTAIVQTYLSSYPTGAHADQARVRLAELKKAEAEMRPGKVFKDCADCPEMVALPAGSFDMGENGETHRVTLKNLAMGKTEITQGQWQAVMGSNPSEFKQCGRECPVDKVSWNDAQSFIQMLNAKTGKSYRLPSESEWEYACRAGSRQEYCGGDSVDAVALYGAYAAPIGNSAKTTNRVGGKQANVWGLYDMSGNVWEWTQDCWNENYGGAPSDGSAWLTGTCGRRVLRGGSWNYELQDSRAANRIRADAAYRNDSIGFRLARMLP